MIIRGNISVLGANSDLVVQSDRFVYIEGFIDVKDDARVLGGIDDVGHVFNVPEPEHVGNVLHGSSVYVATTSRTITRDAGSSIDIRGAKDVDLFGAIVAGGTIGQSGAMFSGPSSSISVTAGEQVFLDTGLLASGTVTVTSGTPSAEDTVAELFNLNANGVTFRTGESLLVHAASELTANDPNGSITLTSDQNASVLGLFVAGGRIDTVRDANGGYFGRIPMYFNGDSVVTLQAGGTIEIGQDIVAGQRIDLIGGTGSWQEPATLGPGLTVQGSGRLITRRPNSDINLNAPGEVVILPPGHISEIEAQGFIHRNDGKLASDVTFAISVDRVDFSYSGTVTLTVEQTADNTGIADLVADLQAAFEAGSFSIVESDNPDRVVRDTFTELADDPSNGTAVVICPGGGYGGHVTGPEAIWPQPLRRTSTTETRRRLTSLIESVVGRIMPRLLQQC